MDLHPLSVHLPIALAVTWPFVDLTGLVLRRDDVSRTAVALLALATLAALFASVTGQLAYDAAIAEGHAAPTLDAHADLAGTLPWLLLATLGVRTVLRPKNRRAQRIVAIVLGFVVAAVVARVGYSGGQLVYHRGVGVHSEGK